MKTILTLIVLFLFSNGYAQEKNFIDLPYLETTAKVDTSVIPDRIYITIVLNEADSKNKKSTEELEKTLEVTLKGLNIDTKSDLSLLAFSSNSKTSLFKTQNILKVKNYTLLVRDAFTASKVFQSLENVDISNVNIERTEYSNSESLLLDLKFLAVKKAKVNALKMIEPLNQKLGKAIFVSDNATISNALQGKINGIQIRGISSIPSSNTAEPILIEFQKIKYESQVSVKFILE